MVTNYTVIKQTSSCYWAIIVISSATQKHIDILESNITARYSKQFIQQYNTESDGSDQQQYQIDNSDQHQYNTESDHHRYCSYTK